MSEAQKLEGFKKKIEVAVSNKDKLQGRLDSDMDKLKSMGYATLEEADEFVTKAKEELGVKIAEFKENVKEFEAKYAQHL